MNYQEIARQARIKVLDLIHKAGTSHIGSNFSIIDIMTVLFEKVDLNKDKVILSKGWAAASLYYFLWRKGRITEEELNSFCMPDSKFIGLAESMCKMIECPNCKGLVVGCLRCMNTRKIEDRFIPIAGGSMGLGLPGAIGLALGKKLKGEEGKVYVLMSDGEMQCGTTWESALIAAHHKLDNLVVIIDKNEYQAMGKTQEILNSYFPHTEPMNHSLRNGHDYEQIKRALNYNIKNIPLILVFETIKGKGVSFMENNNLWHYSHLSTEDYEKALVELNR